MAVIKDVAQKAGVSVSAVSKYFTSPGHMRTDTKERIRKAVEALDYQPSHLAQSLRTGRSGMIAITIPEIDNPYFGDVFDCFHALCSGAGLVPLMLRTNTHAELENTTRILRAGFIDGAICYDAGEAGKLFADQNVRVPLVYMGPPSALPMAHSVVVDLRAGMLELCRHLEERGAKRVGFIGPVDDASAAEKFAALKDYCAGGGLTLDDDFCVPNCYGYEGGFQSCEGFLARGKALPDALIAESDMLAIGLVKCLMQNGVTPPRDIMVSGYDDTVTARMYNPSLTTIHIPSGEMCAEALRVLRGLLAGEAPAEGPAVFKTKLVVRRTTAEG